MAVGHQDLINDAELRTRETIVPQPLRPQLLPELWAIILSCLLDRSDLKTCSLVNHQLNRLTLPFIWARFTLSLYPTPRIGLWDQLSTIIDDPKLAKYICSLRVLFLDPQTELGLAAQSKLESPLPGNNVKDVTIVQVDRISDMPHPQGLPSNIAAISDREIEQALLDAEPLGQFVLQTLEGWLAKSRLHNLSLVNIPFETVNRLLEGPSSVFSLSMEPQNHEAKLQHSPQPLALPGLRSLRTTVHWAQIFLSSNSPTHTLVLLNTDENGGNGVLGRHLRQTRSSIEILQMEAIALFRVPMLLSRVSQGGQYPDLKVFVHMSKGQEGLGPFYDQLDPLQGLCTVFASHQSIHTCVLRVNHYSRDLWTGREIPRTFEFDLALSMTRLEGRFPAPRFILELGTLGKPDFVCWIFTMRSANRWTGQRETNPIEDIIQREDILYVTRN
ncbi:hypothetical protein DL93DRAFT_2095216 [Clavulina sp. PMI_390]|nr:hypothetical protein DL93DRAFT_2095216 [Clavulina sp. PMI_390]